MGVFFPGCGREWAEAERQGRERRERGSPKARKCEKCGESEGKGMREEGRKGEGEEEESEGRLRPLVWCNAC